MSTLVQGQGEAAGYYGGGPQENDLMKDQANPYPPPQGPLQGGPPGYNNNAGGEKANFQFQDAFPIQKPKWNDLWAGIVVSRNGRPHILPLVN